MCLLAAVGCSPGGGTYQEAVTEFVDAWTQGALLCQGQDVCGAVALGVCAEASLPAEDLVAGVHHAHLDIRAIERCQDSAGELGFCVASLECTELPRAGAICAPEVERYSIDCAAFLTALDYLGFDGSGGAPATGGVGGSGGESAGGSGGAVRPSGGTSSGGQAGGGGPAVGGSGGVPAGTGGGAAGSQGVLALALCKRAEHCGGVRFTPEQAAACAVEALPLFGPTIPDVQGTESCIDAASCALLSSDVAAAVASCVDLASAYCLDASTLRACSSSGVCSDASCRDVCAAQGALALGCGPSTAGSMDVCACSP